MHDHGRTFFFGNWISEYNEATLREKLQEEPEKRPAPGPGRDRVGAKALEPTRRLGAMQPAPQVGSQEPERLIHGECVWVGDQ